MRARCLEKRCPENDGYVAVYAMPYAIVPVSIRCILFSDSQLRLSAGKLLRILC